MYQENKKVIFALISLISCITLVYMFFFTLKGDSLNLDTNLTQLSNVDTLTGSVQSQSSISSIVNSSSSSSVSSSIEPEDIEALLDIEDEFESSSSSISSIQLLEGTRLYKGELSVLTALDIKPKYILLDDKNVYMAYLGTGDLKIDQKVRSLSGNAIEIVDKKSINENLLFGDKIIYINLPEYQGKKVAMMVRLNTGDLWFLWIDRLNYHGLKTYLKNLFE